MPRRWLECYVTKATIRTHTRCSVSALAHYVGDSQSCHHPQSNSQSNSQSRPWWEPQSKFQSAPQSKCVGVDWRAGVGEVGDAVPSRRPHRWIQSPVKSPHILIIMTLSPTPFQKYMSSYNQIFILPSYSSSSQRWMPLSRTAPPPSQILPPPSQIALDLTGWARWRPTGREDSSYSLIKVTPSLPSPLPPLSLPRLCALIYTSVNFFQTLPIALHLITR